MILENTMIVSTQVLILFLLIGTGYIARKVHMLDDSGLRQMTNLLLVIVTPCVILRSFQIPYDANLLFGMLIALLSSLATHAIGIILAKVVFRGQPSAQGKVLQFAAVFSNCGFMCIPLLDAVLGSRGVLYGSVYIAVFSVAQWTYGVLLMSGNRSEMNLRRALINPGTIAILIALPFFLAEIRLPAIPTAVIGHLANLNTPVAMLVIGAQMAMISLGSLFRVKMVYIASFLRLVAIPAMMMLVLHFFNLDRELILACLIPAAAPAAAATTLFATRHDQDTVLATQTVALSTLLSIVTIPLLILFSDLIG